MKSPNWLDSIALADDDISRSEQCRLIMPRESLAAKKVRMGAILDGLKHAYPDAHCELNHTSPFELLIATILSAQCTDRQVNIVTESLFRKYRSAADFANAPLDQIENDIRRIGLFRSKARNIRACCQILMDRYQGEVPQTMKELVALNGVGRKTANVVLGNAFNINTGVVVDTHVARLGQRLGLTKEKTPEKIEHALMKLTPQDDWALLSHLLIWHGRRRCSARKPDCAGCEIRDLCPSAE